MHWTNARPMPNCTEAPATATEECSKNESSIGLCPGSLLNSISDYIAALASGQRGVTSGLPHVLLAGSPAQATGNRCAVSPSSAPLSLQIVTKYAPHGNHTAFAGAKNLSPLPRITDVIGLFGPRPGVVEARHAMPLRHLAMGVVLILIPAGGIGQDVFTDGRQFGLVPHHVFIVIALPDGHARASRAYG